MADAEASASAVIGAGDGNGMSGDEYNDSMTQ